MKKILIILVFLQFLIFSKEEVKIVNGFKQGKFIDRLEDGSIEKGKYVNDIKSGEYTFEIPDNNLLLKGNYLNGLLNGVEKIYKNGKYIGEITYFQNKVLGNQVEYIDELIRSGYMGVNNNGYFKLKTPDSIIEYKQENDLVTGQVIINKNNGDKIYLTLFEGITLGDVKYVKRNGEISYYEYLFDIENITKSEEKFLENIYIYLEENKVEKINNLKNGNVKIEVDNAIIEYSYVNNEITGTVRLTFPDIIKEITFKNGKREGIATYTSDNFSEIRSYKNDILEGNIKKEKETLVYSKGKMIKMIQYIDDKTFITTNFINEKPVGNLIITENGKERIIAKYDKNHILVFNVKEYAKNGDKLLFYGSLTNPIYIIAYKKNGEKRQYKSLKYYLENKEYVK
ncbi:hypothetical protein [Streptobacillus moniliformis]|uniref:hypothetical protein n=1 Tax=Streptobacillus moniliformis TaxID=34105 RepID=UPI0007E32B48|nr:hypothetical protein [Streptobacillus moniliformis]